MLFGTTSSSVKRIISVLNLAPTVTSITVTTGASSQYFASYVYYDVDGDLEDDQLPQSKNIIVTGETAYYSGATGNSVGISYEYFHINNSVENSGATFKWYRANDISGTSETQIATGQTHVLVSGDLGKYLRTSVITTTTSGVVGNEFYSDYYLVTTGVTFNPFTDITWDEAFDWSSSLDLNNYGAGNNASAPTTPAFDTDSVKFDRATSEYLTVQAAVAHNAPLETWIEFKTPVSFTGTQCIFNFGNTHRLEYNSSGSLTLSGVATGITLTTSTWYKMRYYINGASSKFRLIGVNNMSDISLSTSSNGTPLMEIGCSNSLTNFYDGRIKTLFIKAGTLSSLEITKMETYYGA